MGIYTLALREDGYPDLEALNDWQPRVAYIQRSAGYDLQRRGLTIGEIGRLIDEVRSLYPRAWVVVDNCYGEFAENSEPLEAGADIIAGSLIKNPGGGLARSGGYVVGRSDLVRRVAGRLTAPGLYDSLGSFIDKRSFFQGLFMAPGLVGQAQKNALFAAALFEELGYEVKPRLREKRTDIVQAIILKSPEKCLFLPRCQGASPVESCLLPSRARYRVMKIPSLWPLGHFPGRRRAAADGPMRDPTPFLQGALTQAYALRHLAATEALSEPSLTREAGGPQKEFSMGYSTGRRKGRDLAQNGYIACQDSSKRSLAGCRRICSVHGKRFMVACRPAKARSPFSGVFCRRTIADRHLRSA